MSESVVEDIDKVFKNYGYGYLQGSSLGSEHFSQETAIFEYRFRKALNHLNPDISNEVIEDYFNTVLKINSKFPMEINKIFYNMLVNGKGTQKSSIQYVNEEIKLIDFDNVENNDFLVVKDFTLKGTQRIMLDYVLFINGLPLVVIETKDSASSTKNLENGKKQLKKYLQQECQQLFYYNQLMIVTNIHTVHVGLVPDTWESITKWEFLYPEIPSKKDGKLLAQEVLNFIIFQKHYLIDFIKNRIVYDQIDNNITKRFSYNLTFPNGEGAINDRATKKDLLERDHLVREISDFYAEYSEKNPFPFYLGIFGRWGMGKSSVIEMLTEYIRNKSSNECEHLVLKMDCSLFDKKDKLWISILNDLLDLLSTEKVNESVKWEIQSFKSKFFSLNVKSWIKDNRGSLLLPVIPLIYLFIHLSYIGTFPKLIPKNFKDAASMVSIITFLYGVFKTGSLFIKQNLFLKDSRNESSSYIKSLKEYKQLISLLNDTEKKKDIKILIVLDELDRIHKDLLPDIIELIQIFKGLNNTSFSENEGEKQKKEENKSVISFVFSFNHDVLFPIIGKNTTLNDKQLLVGSYKKYNGFVEGTEKDAYVDYYKLGKEYMDKYLDLSIYLEEGIDYTRLVKELFKDVQEFPSDEHVVPLSESNKDDIQATQRERKLEANKPIIPFEQKNLVIGSNDRTLHAMSSFSDWEIKTITEIVNKYAKNVEPRKVIRLKNVLIMLKKLNKRTNFEANSLYREELEKFIIGFLEVNGHKKNRTEVSMKNNTNDLEDNNEYFKFTEYFIPSTQK
ncbi:type I restriction endonuclease [Priestia aryabhattai]|uniref:type I site-specific deoxyribonuclease n=1 Tax=Priestia aryabhattai TaxID=412384 RepID=A0ABD7X451_PRIAR|nr:type I restriction endonuclease [Priestia aryabhattai]WEA47197.1 type I restriction endonuclease [Priestia aryabhattai]